MGGACGGRGGALVASWGGWRACPGLRRPALALGLALAPVSAWWRWRRPWPAPPGRAPAGRARAAGRLALVFSPVFSLSYLQIALPVLY